MYPFKKILFPNDYSVPCEAVVPYVKEMLGRFSAASVELIPDPTLQCGDVMFETSHGTLDGSIEAQLQEIERGFADRLSR